MAIGPAPRRKTRCRVDEQAPPKWERVGVNPSCIYFNYHPKTGIGMLAVESTDPSPPAFRDSFLHDDGSYFHTTASLENVIGIIPCRRGPQTFSPIDGLLLQYSDGRRACVGRVRLDFQDPRIVAGTSGIL